MIVQAELPFLAVHVNTAFLRLAGMDNSDVIGRPLSNILSLSIDTNEWVSAGGGKEAKPSHPRTAVSDKKNNENDCQEQKTLSSITKIMRKSKKADGLMIGLREIHAAQYSLIRAHPRD